MLRTWKQILQFCLMLKIRCPLHQRMVEGSIKFHGNQFLKRVRPALHVLTTFKLNL